jgi:hypothetical protein
VSHGSFLPSAVLTSVIKQNASLTEVEVNDVMAKELKELMEALRWYAANTMVESVRDEVVDFPFSTQEVSFNIVLRNLD